MKNYENMHSSEVLAEYRKLQATRKQLVAKTGDGAASVEDLQQYMVVRKAMQPLYLALVRRGIDINFLTGDELK